MGTMGIMGGVGAMGGNRLGVVGFVALAQGIGWGLWV